MTKFKEMLIEDSDSKSRIVVRLVKDEDFKGEAFIQVRRFHEGTYVYVRESDIAEVIKLLRSL